jgi:hypothetical protein
LDANRALESGTEAGEREAEDMKALFEEDEASPQSKGRIRLVLMLLTLSLIGIVGAATVNPEIGRQLNRALTLIGIDASFFDRQDQGRSVVDAAYERRSLTTSADTTQQTTLENPSEINKSDQLAPDTNERLVAATEIAQSAPASDEATEVPTDESAPNNTDISTGSDGGPVADRSAQASADVVREGPITEERSETSNVAVNQNASNLSSLPGSNETQLLPQELSDSESTPNPALALVKDANPTSQFVQHIVLASAERADEWLGTQNGLDRAMVVPVSVNNTRRFAVVSGPFATRAEVRAYIQGMDQTADYWVRTARSLQRIALIGDE